MVSGHACGLPCAEFCEAPAAVMKFAKSPKQGAETSVQLALSELDSSGGYWVDGKCLGCQVCAEDIEMDRG